jgi:NAD(P)-dependent dehydrogenase (short-subunit alcohol dehydrogenase family)
VLIHCAGIAAQKNILDCDLADWRRIIEVNLTGTFLCCREVARAMANNGGSVVVLASSSAVRPGVNSSAYAASKGGVANFVRAAAVDLAPKGIRVNAVSPGPIETDMVQRTHSEEFRSRFTALIPQRRYGRPEEVAGAAVFLASDDSSFITGCILAVDGGFTSSGVVSQ